MKLLKTNIAGLGSFVRAIRQKAEMSQTELAEKSEISQFAITSIETGRTQTPSLSIIQRIANTFRCDVVILFVRRNVKSNSRRKK